MDVEKGIQLYCTADRRLSQVQDSTQVNVEVSRNNLNVNNSKTNIIKKTHRQHIRHQDNHLSSSFKQLNSTWKKTKKWLCCSPVLLG